MRSVSCHCGSSISEALSLECQFDTVSASWLPAQCRDDELAAEFDRAGPGGKWEYWADMAMTRQLKPEQVGALVDKLEDEAYVWVSWGWHVSHCSFYWRKQVRMAERPRQHATTVGFQFLRGRDGDDPDGYLKELLSSTGSSHLISSHLIIIFTSHLHIFTSQYLVFAHLFPLTIQTFKQHHPP